MEITGTINDAAKQAALNEGVPGIGHSSEGAYAKPGNTKHVTSKMKAELSMLPERVLLFVAAAFSFGARKHGGRTNWRQFPVNASMYYDAARRHMIAWWEGAENPNDSYAHHIDHAIASLMIIRDAILDNNLEDDRPIPGDTPANRVLDWANNHTRAVIEGQEQNRE